MENKISPVKAIRLFCIDCSGGSLPEVKECRSFTCPLHPFRFGKNPFIKREMTDEQREAAKERLAAARERKMFGDDQ
jgi:hypothetical protein